MITKEMIDLNDELNYLMALTVADEFTRERIVLLLMNSWA